jgi:hypothetical protein
LANILTRNRLGFKTLLVAAASLLLGVAVFQVLQMALYHSLDMRHLSGVELEQAKASSVERLRDFVAESNLSLAQAGEVQQWVDSERYVMLPRPLLRLLEQQRALQNRRRRELGEAWENSGAVFANQHGGFFNEKLLIRKLKRLVQRVGLPDHIHVHSLRHTNASLLINAGVPPKMIADQLGHASTDITQNVYSHVFHSSKVKLQEVLEVRIASLAPAGDAPCGGGSNLTI